MQYYTQSEGKWECTKCFKQLCGSSRSNIVRHYRLVHKMDIVLTKKRKTQSVNGGNDEDGASSMSLENDMTFTDFEIRNEADPLEAYAATSDSKILMDIPNVDNVAMDKNHFLKCCLGLVTIKNMPLNIFDDAEYFKPLLELYEQKFNINLNSHYMAKLLDESSSKVCSFLKNRFKNQMISLKIDIVARMHRYMVVLHIQYVDNTKLCTDTIGVIPIDRNPNGTWLSAQILKCLQLYEIACDQLYSSTIDIDVNYNREFSQILQELNLEQEDEDYTADDLKMIKEIDKNIVVSIISSLIVSHCPTHCVANAGGDVIQNFCEQIEDCRKSVKQLRDLIFSNNLNVTMPVVGHISNWHSIYEMLKTLLNFKHTENDILKNSDVLKKIDWDFVVKFILAYAPMIKLAEQLKQEQYVLGDFFRDWLNCEVELEEVENDIATHLIECLKFYKKEILENSKFVAALYLDPRFNFNGSPMLSDEQKSQALDFLLKTYESIKKLKYPDVKFEPDEINNSEECDYDNPQPITTPKSAYAKLQQRVMSCTKASRSFVSKLSIRQKLIALMERNMVPFQSNMLQYMHNICLDEDILKLMNVALAVPANQRSFLRSYEALARSNLDSDQTILSNLLLTKWNFSQIKLEFPDA